MSPTARALSGALGEQTIIRRVPCPNCGRSLEALPHNYPMYDVQCKGCSFRAQVKTSRTRPKDTVFGAGWDIIDKVLKAGFLLPPLLVHFCWIEGRRRHARVQFYPFIPRTHVAKRTMPQHAQNAGYRMFNYVRLSELPMMLLLDE